MKFNRSSAKKFLPETITQFKIFFEKIAEIGKKLISENGDIDIDELNKKFDSQFENWHSNQISKTKAVER